MSISINQLPVSREVFALEIALPAQTFISARFYGAARNVKAEGSVNFLFQ